MVVWCEGLAVLRFDEPRPVTLIVVPLLVPLVQRASFVHQRIGLFCRKIWVGGAERVKSAVGG